MNIISLIKWTFPSPVLTPDQKDFWHENDFLILQDFFERPFVKGKQKAKVEVIIGS
jgi:hypothetical protein